MLSFECVYNQFKQYTVFNWQPAQVFHNRRNVIKTHGIRDEPCLSFLNPLQLVNITGW